MSLHYHYEMIVDKAIKGAVNDIVQLDFPKRAQIVKVFEGVRNEVLAVILPEVYGKPVVDTSASAVVDADVPACNDKPAVDMVHVSGGLAEAKPAKAPSKRGGKK